MTWQATSGSAGPAHHGAEDAVLAVQVAGALVEDEELAAVGAGPAVGHGHHAASRRYGRAVCVRSSLH